LDSSKLSNQYGGLGLRRAADVNLSAFLASASFCRSSMGFREPLPFELECYNLWSSAVQAPPPLPENEFGPTQKDLDGRYMSKMRSLLINRADLSEKDLVRLMGTKNLEGGQFLNAIPSRNLGLFLEDQELMIAVAIRTGCSLTAKHKCLNCPDFIEEDGLHGLCCQKGVVGRAARHKGLNLWLANTLKSIDVGSRLEPEDLWRGKRPDGVSVLPWANGLRVVWDFTIIDSFAITYRRKALEGSGQVADIAEMRKMEAYRGLDIKYIIQPVAIDTLGAFGSSTRVFIDQIGKLLIKKTGDSRAASFIKQKLSLELQRFNSWCIRESLDKWQTDDESLDFLDIMENEEE
jgi:hypothetical protein